MQGILGRLNIGKYKWIHFNTNTTFNVGVNLSGCRNTMWIMYTFHWATESFQYDVTELRTMREQNIKLNKIEKCSSYGGSETAMSQKMLQRKTRPNRQPGSLAIIVSVRITKMCGYKYIFNFDLSLIFLKIFSLKAKYDKCCWAYMRLDNANWFRFGDKKLPL